MANVSVRFNCLYGIGTKVMFMFLFKEITIHEPIRTNTSNIVACNSTFWKMLLSTGTRVGFTAIQKAKVSAVAHQHMTEEKYRPQNEQTCFFSSRALTLTLIIDENTLIFSWCIKFHLSSQTALRVVPRTRPRGLCDGGDAATTV